MGDLEERLGPAAERVLATQPVLFAYLFGSHARGDARPDSDVDVAVLLARHAPPERYLDLRLSLAAELESAAGLGPVEVVVLNEAPPALRGRIVRDRVVLWSGDEPARVAFESRTLREFADFNRHDNELARLALRDVAAGLR